MYMWAPVNTTKNGASICQALSRLSPEVFFHPIWVHFDDFCKSFSLDLIHELHSQTQELLTKGELYSACQLILLCAALYKRLNDYPAALTSAQQAWTMAELYDMPQVAKWAAWGASALCAQQGQYQQAAEHLNSLHVKLSESSDWILANFIEVIGRMVTQKGRENSLVMIAYDWLMHWGDSPLNIEAGHMRDNDRYHHPKDISTSVGMGRHSPGAWWHSFLHTFKRIAQGDLRLKWVDGNRVATSAAVSRISIDPSIPLPSLDPSLANRFPHSASLVLSENFPPPDAHQTIPQARITGPTSHHPLLTTVATNEQRTSLFIYTLGSFRVYQNDQLIEAWSSRKAQSVFKYLVAHHPTPISKDILMDTFWPDADPEGARRNLHQAIYALRQMLKGKGFDFQHILFENECYLLNPELDIWLDYKEFEGHVWAGQQYEQNHDLGKAMNSYGMAEGLYLDNFLSGDLYEEWPVAQRHSLWQTYLLIAQRLAQYYLARQEYSAAIALSRRILGMENAQEEAHQILMRCYLAQGQRHLAFSQYQLCVQALKSELDLPPSAETEALYQQIAKG